MASRDIALVIDDSTFQKRARALARKLKIDEYDFVKEQTGLLARDNAKYTPPYASYPSKGKSTIGSTEDHMRGIEAVRQDILKIIYPQEQKVIDWAIANFGTRPTYKGGQKTSNGVLLSINQLKRWHDKNRNKKGRTRPLKSEFRYWVSYPILDKYIDMEIENVGISKAAFAKAGLQLGAKGSIPKWVKRHIGKVSGGGKMARTSNGAYGVIFGRAPGLAHLYGKTKSIQRDRLIKALKRLEFIGKQASKNAGFKVY